MRHSIFGLHTLRRARLAAGLAAALACASHALAWWNGDWNQRKLVTLDTTATGGAIGDPIGGTPVLLRLSDGNFNFAAARSDGSDLRFVAADDRTPLAFHIERFDATMNEAFVWVQLPEVKAGARTTFWLYFSNPGKGGPAAPEPKATYDADTALVYHFAERDRPPADSSPAGNNGQTIGLTAEGSMIGPGLRIDGKTTVSIPAAASLFWTEGAGLTWSAWIKPAVLAPNAVVFSRRDAAHYFLIGLDRGAPFVEVTHQGGTVRSPAGAPVAVNSWHRARRLPSTSTANRMAS